MRRGADRSGTGRRLVQSRVGRRIWSDGQQREARIDGCGRLPLMRLIRRAVQLRSGHRAMLARECSGAKVQWRLLLKIHLL